MLTTRDTDLIILSKLDDKDLFSTCLVNKAANKLCNNEDFWRNRFVSKYGELAAKYKPENRSWRNHYLKVIIDLEKFPKPVDFLSHILWGSEGIENSLYIENPKDMFIGPGKWIPLSEAPEWVMNNLWLLKLGDLKINFINQMGSEMIELKQQTPIGVLNKISEKFFITPEDRQQVFNLYTFKGENWVRSAPNTFSFRRLSNFKKDVQNAKINFRK